MPSSLSRRVRFAGIFLSLIGLLVLGTFAWGWTTLNRSLPTPDGEVTSPGLTAPANLARDAAGVVTITATHETDAHHALGFAHAQDRFFQMDLARRRPAAELSALVGKAALELDRPVVIHRFRTRARDAVAALPAALRPLLDAYVAGVNAGLAALPRKPWEYTALRTIPAPWLPEDSLLVAYSIALQLQETDGGYEWNLARLRDELGIRAPDFFNPLIGPTDDALDGTTQPLGPPPTPRAIDLRTSPAAPTLPSLEPETRPGSNAFGFGATGGALLAGDPHLDLGVPNVWYRAALLWGESTASLQRVEGLTLPGLPGVVIGSNGHLAWTFTNAYVDVSDLVQIDLNVAAPELFYMEGTELREFEKRTDTIHVKGADPVTVNSTWTHWGPLVAQSREGRPFALRWTLHEPGTMDLAVLRLAHLHRLDDAIPLLQAAGLPPLNAFIASHDGRLAWTLAGRLPDRFGFDGRFPTTWTFGDRGWHGLLPPERAPSRIVGPGEFLWSGNQRKLGGKALALLGDGGYAPAPRAARIHTRLRDLAANPSTAPDPADLLSIQLDVTADWLAPWRDLLLADLDEAALAAAPARRVMRDAITAPDALSAAADSVGYRHLRSWHEAVRDLTLAPLFAPVRARHPGWSTRHFNLAPAVYSLHHDTDQPHLRDPAFATWRDLRLAAVDGVLAAARHAGVDPATATWGERNRAYITHPFSRLFPGGLGNFLNLPRDPLPGDNDVPRVQSPAFGASARLVVSPGRESEGFLHVPGGQSGHPLSPFYRAGHRDWVEGNPSPFQPGPSVHILVLLP